MKRGEIWWASLPPPAGSSPGFRRPVLIVSSDSFNRSKIATVIAAVVTTNLRLAAAPGNVRVAGKGTGLSKPSVVNVSQVVTLDKAMLASRAGSLGPSQMGSVDRGLQLALGLTGPTGNR
jgi:mRNA interferase MazF